MASRRDKSKRIRFMAFLHARDGEFIKREELKLAREASDGHTLAVGPGSLVSWQGMSCYVSAAGFEGTNPMPVIHYRQR